MSRASYLTVPQQELLIDWAVSARSLFPGRVMAYLVGSSLVRADYRDVDVRVILSDKPYAKLIKTIQLPRLHLAVSLWGTQVTGLPIDFQVQQMTAANHEFKGARNALFRVEP